jgi:hypothetical protein
MCTSRSISFTRGAILSRGMRRASSPYATFAATLMCGNSA